MSELLKYTLITSLVVTGLGILGVMVLGELPDSTIIIDPYFDNAVAFCAYSFMVLCVAGFFCIFIKAIRIPVGVATCVLLLFFLNCACWNAVLQNVSYRVARGSEPSERTIVIDGTDDITDSMMLRFLNNEDDGTVPADVPEYLLYRLHEGDTCVAVVWDGLIGVRFISKIKNVRRKNNNNS